MNVRNLQMIRKFYQKLLMFQHLGQKSKIEFGNQKSKGLFGIAQGGLFKDLRIESIEKLIEVGFDGYAMGGLAVGGKQSEMFKILNETASYLPQLKPRYLMGVGTPSDILEQLKRV